MAKCLQYSDTSFDSSGQEYERYFANELELSTCGDGAGQQIILTGTEYVRLKNNAAENFLSSLFDPSYISTADYEMIFMLGFTTPLFAYFVAWGYQTVISFMTKH